LAVRARARVSLVLARKVGMRRGEVRFAGGRCQRLLLVVFDNGAG